MDHEKIKTKYDQASHTEQEVNILLEQILELVPNFIIPRERILQRVH